MTDSDVIIVGGGPVGLGLAIDLSLRGISVCVVERHKHPQRIPKGQNLTQRTGEHFHVWGISEAIRAASPIPPSYGNEGLTAYGSIFSGYHYDWFKRASVREYYAADNERLPQYETERLLQERAIKQSNIKLMRGWSFASQTQTNDGVTVHVSETSGNAVKTLSAQYLIGCDGARSLVRDAAGLPQTIDARGKHMALLVFNSSKLNALLESEFPGKTIFNAIHPSLEGYWQFLGRVDLENNWFFHAPVTPNATRENYDFNALLTRAIGKPIDVEFSHIGFWDLRFAHADCYGRGRSFLAGDAAHSHPPYGGYGVNIGFEDARNLSWKLAATIQGWGSQNLLDSYHEERHPVFASTRDHFIARMIDEDARFVAQYNPDIDRAAFESAWQQRSTGGQAEVSLYVPNYAGSSIVWGASGERSGAIGQHDHQALAGHHLSPQRLANGTSVYDELGTDFTLIAIEQPHSVIHAFREASETLKLPLKIIESTRTSQTDRWRAGLILVRPDNFVAFAADHSRSDYLNLLRRAIGAG